MRVTLYLVDGHIQNATYETYQCPGCVACGQAIAAMSLGLSIESAAEIKHEDLVARVGPLPRHRQICYGLALLALSDALGQAVTK